MSLSNNHPKDQCLNILSIQVAIRHFLDKPIILLVFLWFPIWIPQKYSKMLISWANFLVKSTRKIDIHRWRDEFLPVIVGLKNGQRVIVFEVAKAASSSKFASGREWIFTNRNIP